MTNFVKKYPDEVIIVTMDWEPGFAAGDTLDAVQPLEFSGSTPPAAVLVGTVGNVSTIRLGPDAEIGSGRVNLTALMDSGEILGENIHVTIRSR